MQYISGIARNQMIFTSLSEPISNDNPGRFIDAFVENIDLKALGFELQTPKTEGRLSFNTQTFFKIYCTVTRMDFKVEQNGERNGAKRNS